MAIRSAERNHTYLSPGVSKTFQNFVRSAGNVPTPTASSSDTAWIYASAAISSDLEQLKKFYNLAVDGNKGASLFGILASVSGSVTGRSGHASSPKPCQNPKSSFRMAIVFL